MEYPKGNESEESIRIDFQENSTGGRSVEVEIVLDFNGLGELVGIEIINLALIAGENAIKSLQKTSSFHGDAKFSYDKGSDACYVKLRKDRSIDQRAVDGVLILDKGDQILTIETKLQ